MLSLNIYEGTEIKKTYTADSAHILVGTVAQIFKMFDVDKLATMTTQQVGVEILITIVKNFDLFKLIMKDVFIGLTDEEYAKCRLDEMTEVAKEVLIYVMNTFTQIESDNKKNRK